MILFGNVKNIEVRTGVGERTIYFFNRDGNYNYFFFRTNMFADIPSYTLELKDGEELIGFSFLLDDKN